MLILNVIFCTDEQLMFSADCGLNPKNNLEIFVGTDTLSGEATLSK